MAKTVFEKYINYRQYEIIQKIHDGYHVHTFNNEDKYRFVLNYCSIINFNNDRVKIPKSTYKLITCNFFNRLIPYDVLKADKDSLNTLKHSVDFISLGNSKYSYNGKLIKLMSIISNTKFLYLVKKDILYLYDISGRFQGMLLPFINK